jgi:uncharacterized protein (UPF0335 family)
MKPNIENVVLKLLEDFEKNIEDQSNYRFIQDQLEEGKNNELVQKLYTKALVKIEKYMCLPFGNYLCQKLFELLTEDQLHFILKKIKPVLQEIAKDAYGTRSIQQLIKVSINNDKLRNEIIRILKPYLKSIIIVIHVVK